MPNTMSIVAFFSGTENAYAGKMLPDGDPRKHGYIKSNKRMRGRDVKETSQFLTDDQVFYGFDGSPSLLWAKVEEPAERMLAILREKLLTEPSLDKIKLILNGHSRGCLSAYLLAKSISEDKVLRDKIDITLDLHDPMPGNFKVTSALGLGISGKVADLTRCQSIVKASVSINMSNHIGHSTLIPSFHKNTEVDVDFFPGGHFAQSFGRVATIEPDGSFNTHLNAYLLAQYRSLQIYSENEVNLIDYAYILGGLVNRHESAEYGFDGSEGTKAAHREIVKFIAQVRQHPIGKKEFELILHTAQCLLYEGLLNDYKDRAIEPTVYSHLHGGGYNAAIHPVAEATHFNSRHASLDHQLQTRSLFGYRDSKKRPTELARAGARQKPVPLFDPAAPSTSTAVAGPSTSAAPVRKTSEKSLSYEAADLQKVTKGSPFLILPEVGLTKATKKSSRFFGASSMESVFGAADEHFDKESLRHATLQSYVTMAINATKLTRSSREGSHVSHKANLGLSKLTRELRDILNAPTSTTNKMLNDLVELIDDYSKKGGGHLKGTSGQFCINLLSLLAAKPVDSGNFHTVFDEYKALNEPLPGIRP